MSIDATCGACGRKFVAPTRFQGKRVKCKGCGEVFAVPFAGASGAGASTAGASGSGKAIARIKPPAELDPVSQLAATLNGSAQPVVQDQPVDRHQGHAAETDDTHAESDPLAGGGLGERLGGGLGGAFGSRSWTPNVLTFDYPGADDVDRWLPLTLIVGGLLVLLASSSNLQTRGMFWIPIARFLTHALLYLGLVFPVTLGMVRKGARELRYAMPPQFRQRCFACYFPAFILMTLPSSDGFTLAQFSGGFMGLIISTGLLWLLFRLRQEHVGTMAAYGAGGFTIAAVLGILLTVALNAAGKSIVVSEQAQASVPISPFGDGMSWVSPPAPPPVAEAPVPVASSKAVAATSSLPVLIGSLEAASFAGQIDDVINPLNGSPYVGLIRRKTNSVSIESCNITTGQSKPGTLQLPAMPAGRMVISTDGEYLAWIADFPHLSVQVWAFATGGVVSTVDLDRSRGRYDPVGFISSDLLLIDRTQAPAGAVSAAPAPNEPIKPLVKAPPTKVKQRNIFDMDPDPPPADPAPVPEPTPGPIPPGNFSPATVDATHHLFAVDVITGKTLTTFNLPALAREMNAHSSPDANSETAPVRLGKNIAVSLVSNRLAAAIQTSDNPSLVQIDLITGERLVTMKVAEVDPGMSGSLTGLAYSNDGQSLAALYENAGSALLLSYDSKSAAKLSQFVFPAGPLDGSPHGPFEGSAICWLDPLPCWLVFGQGLQSTKTGVHMKQADLNLPDAAGQRLVDADQVQILIKSGDSRKLLMLKLDGAKLSKSLGMPLN